MAAAQDTYVLYKASFSKFSDYDNLKLKGTLEHKQPFKITSLLQGGNTSQMILNTDVDMAAEVAAGSAVKVMSRELVVDDRGRVSAVPTYYNRGLLEEAMKPYEVKKSS